MPKLKKGFRSQFERRKNDSKSRKGMNKENNDPQADEEAEQMCSELVLPENWQRINDDQFCKIVECSSGGGLKVTVSLTFASKWVVHVGGKEVPDTCEVFKSLDLLDQCKAADFMNAIDRSFVCIGNPEEAFTNAWQEKEGKKRDGVTGELERASVVDPKGNVYDSTLRKKGCSILCKVLPTGNNLRCKQCQAFRSTLRGMVLRQSRKSDNRTSASSHTPYGDLTSTEKNERMKALHTSVRSANQRVRRMQARVDKLIAKDSIQLESDDVDDISDLITNANPIVQAKFQEDSPQRILWEQQLKYNQLKDKRQMRWHPLVIRFALNLKYLSGTAYQAVRHFGLNLPSERTLYDYTHWTKAHSGIQYEFIESFVSQVEEGVSCGHYHCALSMDEMKLKSGLVFKHRSGVLSGFVDLGKCNREIEMMMGGDDSKDEDDSESVLAEQVFQFDTILYKIVPMFYYYHRFLFLWPEQCSSHLSLYP